jgi:hypothetical protein
MLTSRKPCEQWTRRTTGSTASVAKASTGDGHDGAATSEHGEAMTTGIELATEAMTTRHGKLKQGAERQR